MLSLKLIKLLHIAQIVNPPALISMEINIFICGKNAIIKLIQLYGIRPNRKMLKANHEMIRCGQRLQVNAAS